MTNISRDQFIEKKKSGKVFSLITEYRGDEVTPIRIFNGFKGRRRFIFESGSTENYFGRYSFLGEDPYKEIVGETIKEIDELKKNIRVDFDESTNNFSFKGGAIGYMGYETVALYENKLKFKNPDDLDLPLIRFNLYSRYICYDHFTHKVFVIDNILNNDNREYESILKNQKEYILSLLDQPTNIEDFEEKKDIHFEFCTTKEKYEQNVRIGKEHILAGDIFQFVPSLRMKCITDKSFVEIYRRLREVNPSPYMYLIDYDDYQVIGASPESVVSVKNGKASTKPIAGTRKRGATP
ncbi:chorismate-binding protein, partial [uncultured Clostridium sp.]|uniref:chorismate-binding protein n=1 Tax=uncultured Clostridium sp. TaxID=59620 RepID=UPI0025D03504